MNAATVLLGFLSVQRGTELAIATRNTKSLLARGAYERGAGHYPTMVALHATWLATLWIFGRKRDVDARFVVAFALLQAGRAWVLATLGERWTTRIILLPGAPPIVRGPFRFLRHPNYAVVALEVPCVALALGLRRHAALFGVLDLAMLAWRIRAEDRGYAELASTERASAERASAEGESLDRDDDPRDVRS